MSNILVNVIFEDSKGNLWFGTHGGLDLFNPKTQTFKKYTQQDGIPSSAVVSIEEDNRGNLWLGTLAGLCQFNPVNGHRKVYTDNDGLQANEFTQGASLKTENGELYFGGINGFNIFNPDKIKPNNFIPPVLITDFTLFNKKVKIGENSILKKNINEVKKIELSYKESVFSFEFSALNYILTEKNQYMYKMEGFDKEWLKSNNRIVTYTNLDPGTYTFKVKGSNNDGIWNNKAAEIEIVITPPFWKTWWFRILGVVFFLGIIYLWNNRRIAAIQSQKDLLEKEVKERTAEVVKQKEKIENQSAHREELYYDMKDNIRAAQVIQRSLLPVESRIKEHLSEFFIINRPKDVVSGDFYWFDVVEDKIIIAVADCTGHGVTGAFMSINGHHLLNQTIRNQSKLSPDLILNDLNDAIINELHYSESEVDIHNGMDISLCIIDKTKGILEFAGANSQIYIVREKEIIPIKGDKYPIGLMIEGKLCSFVSKKFEIKAGDILYLFSDGYADQLGGETGNEKLMYHRFRETLINNSRFSLGQQKDLLINYFDTWRGTREQIDDILVMGIKVQ
jgi:serine phosphatase RsbU (regulator of sigma subunit)